MVRNAVTHEFQTVSVFRYARHSISVGLLWCDRFGQFHGSMLRR